MTENVQFKINKNGHFIFREIYSIIINNSKKKPEQKYNETKQACNYIQFNIKEILECKSEQLKKPSLLANEHISCDRRLHSHNHPSLSNHGQYTMSFLNCRLSAAEEVVEN
jgi:hypothetical protein